MVDVKINLQSLAGAAMNAITPGATVPEIKPIVNLKPLSKEQLKALMNKVATLEDNSNRSV
jgi:hypothetical protein